MTNKEAIELLKPLTQFSKRNGLCNCPVVSDEETANAVRLAIKVLTDRAVIEASLNDMLGVNNNAVN